jgi:hypothetical protein
MYYNANGAIPLKEKTMILYVMRHASRGGGRVCVLMRIL